MNKAYHFRVGPLIFILNLQYSGIGFCYPRVFVAFPDDSYINCDITLDAMFSMSESDFMSWLDGTEIKLEDIEEVRKVFHEAGLKWDTFEEIIFDYYTQAIAK